MTRFRIHSIFILFNCVLLLPAAVASENLLPSSSDWTASILERVDCVDCITGDMIVLKLENDKSGRSETIVIDKPVVDLKYVKIYKSLLAVVGEVPFGDVSVSIYNLDTMKTSAYFLAYFLHSSPSGRYFVYKKYFPRFSAEHRATIMMVDLENLISKSTHDNTWTGGTPVYPIQAKSVKGEAKLLSTPDFAFEHVIFDEPDRFIFTGYEANSNVILVVVNTPVEPLESKLSICVVPIISGQIDSEHLVQPKRNVVQKLEYLPPNKARLTLYEVGGVEGVFTANLAGGCLGQ